MDAKKHTYTIRYTFTVTVFVRATTEEDAIDDGEYVAVDKVVEGDGVHIEPEIIART